MLHNIFLHQCGAFFGGHSVLDHARNPTAVMKGGERFEDEERKLDYAGLLTSLAGFAITQAQSWVSEQQMSMMVDEKIEEALAKRDENEDDEES